MRHSIFYKIIILFGLFFAAFSALAWDHGVSLGYGGGSDINHHTDTNSGAFLSAEFMSIKQRNWMNLTLNGSLGGWYSTAATNKDLFTAALSVALRLYPCHSAKMHPFFLASVGPAYLSDTHFGRNAQANNFAFQTVAGVGIEVGKAKRVDLNLRLMHFSNAYLMHPNQGFNIFYVASVGYLF